MQSQYRLDNQTQHSRNVGFCKIGLTLEKYIVPIIFTISIQYQPDIASILI